MEHLYSYCLALTNLTFPRQLGRGHLARTNCLKISGGSTPPEMNAASVTGNAHHSVFHGSVALAVAKVSARAQNIVPQVTNIACVRTGSRSVFGDPDNDVLSAKPNAWPFRLFLLLRRNNLFLFRLVFAASLTFRWSQK